MIHTILHRYLRVPYALHVREVRRVKKPRATILFLHGIGSSGAEWREVIELLPDDVTILAVDMLGFGKSPRPEWAKYSASEQARSVIATLIKAGVTGRCIVVGHSLGALVAVEVAKRYPVVVKSLVLCSPPFYNPDRGTLPSSDKMLQRLYGKIEQNQASFLRLARFAIKHKLVNEAFSVDAQTLPSYIQTLKASIISQTAFNDVKTIKKPITIVHGSLDPFVINRNLRAIKRANPHVHLVKVLAGHEIMGRSIPAVAAVIRSHAGSATS